MQTDSTNRSNVAVLLGKYWEWLLLSACVVGAGWIYRSYGLCWDSEVNAAYAERVLNYFLSGFTDRSCNTAPGVLHFYGTLFELPSAALHRVLGLDKHALRGLLSAFAAVATVPPLIRLGRKLGGERVAFFSAMALLLMPQFFGHAFINAKDIPLACAVTWAVWAVDRMVTRDEFGWRAVLGVGVAIGAVLAIRVGAVFILVFLVAAIGLRRLQLVAVSGWRSFAPPSEALWPLRRKAWAACALGWFIIVALWPYAHENPLLNPFRAYRVASAFPNVYEVLFAGRFLPSNELPRSYLPVYLSLVTPPAILVFALFGGWKGVREFLKTWRATRSLTLFLVLFWIAFPIAYVLVARPNIYDSVRHFIFILPAFALLAGVGAESLFVWLGDRLGRVSAWFFLVVVLGTAVVSLCRWHPYQYAYLNLFAGERSTLHERYETEYWVTSYRAAAHWLNQRQASSARPLRVLASVNDHSYACLAHYLDRRIQIIDALDRVEARSLPADFDAYVSTVRHGLHRNFPDTPVVWEERRDGVLLCVIRSAPK